MSGMFQAQQSVIKSIQEFSITIDSGQTANTATITAVVVAKSFVVCSVRGMGGGNTLPYQATGGATLTNSTTVTAGNSIQAYGGGGCTIDGFVIEYK